MLVRNLKYALKANASRHVYIGSGERARNIPRSPLAMPYELRQLNWKDDDERSEKIAQYRVYLWHIMQNESDPRHAAVWSELRKLKDDSILLCYCYPRNCHGHVIAKAWQWAVAQGMIDVPSAAPTLQQTTTNEQQLVTLETQARANLTKATTTMERHGDKGQERTYTTTPALLPKHVSPGPLDMQSILRELGKQYTALTDARIDEEILSDMQLDEQQHAREVAEGMECTQHDFCQSVPAPPAKPRTTRRPRLSFDEPRSLVWNEYDDIAADVADLYTTTAA